MVRSRSFIAVSLVTAASLAVSSVAVARPMLPVVSVDGPKNPSIQLIDDWHDNREHKQVQWERNYHDQGGPGKGNQGKGNQGKGNQGHGNQGPGNQGYGNQGPGHGQKGPQPAYKGSNKGQVYVVHPPVRTVVIVKPVPAGPRYAPPPYRRVQYRNVWVVRPYGHWYPGYGYYYKDDAAYHFLAFTAITLSLLSLLTVAQQRAQEQAQIDAATAPVGSTINWNDANAAGSVAVLRDGHSSDGQYCREFQQNVTVGGRSEQAYGTACQQPDGAWKIVSTQQ